MLHIFLGGSQSLLISTQFQSLLTGNCKGIIPILPLKGEPLGSHGGGLTANYPGVTVLACLF